MIKTEIRNEIFKIFINASETFNFGICFIKSFQIVLIWFMLCAIQFQKYWVLLIIQNFEWHIANQLYLYLLLSILILGLCCTCYSRLLYWSVWRGYFEFQVSCIERFIDMLLSINKLRKVCTEFINSLIYHWNVEIC